MTEINAGATPRRGPAIRQARLARVRKIRRRVITGALSLFVATWLLIAIVLATGHDPALSRDTAVAAVSGAGASTTSGQTTSGTTSASTGSTGSTASTGSTGSTGSTASTSTRGSASSVTTRQS